MVEIIVNTEGSNCCKGYTITTSLIPPPTGSTGTSGTTGGDVGTTGGDDVGTTGGDDVGTGDGSGRNRNRRKTLGGDGSGNPIAETVAPPPPIAPPEGAAGEQIIISISSASIDSDNVVIIVGQNFMINGIPVISSILFDSDLQSVFIVESSTIITTTLPVVLPAESFVQVQLILDVPPGLSNIVLAQVPAEEVVPVTFVIDEHGNGSFSGSGSDSAYIDLTAIPAMFRIILLDVITPTVDGNGSTSATFVETIGPPPLFHILEYSTPPPFTSTVLSVSSATSFEVDVRTPAGFFLQLVLFDSTTAFISSAVTFVPAAAPVFTTITFLTASFTGGPIDFTDIVKWRWVTSRPGTGTVAYFDNFRAKETVSPSLTLI